MPMGPSPPAVPSSQVMKIAPLLLKACEFRIKGACCESQVSADGKAQSVAYHLLPAMLLNEMQKQIRENQRKLAQIAALQQRLVAQERQISALQRETARIDMLTARLNVLEQQQARRARPERLAATSAAPMPR